MSKSHKDLEIYNEALNLFFETHKTSLKLPKYELYELGSQIRRSADSIVSNIVEGYGRGKYKQEFLRFLTFSHASCLETQCHLEKLQEIYPDLKKEFQELLKKYDILGAKIYKFTQYVTKNWNTPLEPKTEN